MKTIKLIFLGLVLAFGLFSCTKDFVEINKNPNAITSDEASAKYFITIPQYKLYAPDRYPYWRANLILTDRYAGHFTFGMHGSWWSDELGYSYSASYTDAAWDWLEGYLGGLDNFMKLTDVGGDFENELMYSCGLIIKGLYYQMFTDAFGEIPYSEAADPDIALPKFDGQKEIYQGIIADLDAAMATIGTNERTGDGVNDLGENDLYCGGDLQKWKKLANTLKLRIATRAFGATGDDFASAAITAALAGPLLADESDNILLEKDNVISQWNAAAYSDVWYRFGGYGSKWSVGQVLINYLLKNNDPRISKYAKFADGGTFTFDRPDEDDNPEGYDNFEKRVTFIAHAINEAIDLQGGDTSGVFTLAVDLSSATFDVPSNAYYIGQPTRFGGKIKSYVRAEFFSDPAEPVIQFKNEGKPIYPEVIMTTAESYFLQAQAALNQIGGGGALPLYKSGIEYAMMLWGVSSGDAQAFTSGINTVTLEDVAVQRWIATYTDGFEAWSIVRNSGFPSELSGGVSDLIIFGLGDAGLNGAYPQRLKYGNQVYNTNLDNVNEAIARQGADEQGVKLWWAK